jgi:hypothetical protein
MVIGIVFDDGDCRDDGVESVSTGLKNIHAFVEGTETVCGRNHEGTFRGRSGPRACGYRQRPAKQICDAGNRAAGQSGGKEFASRPTVHG